MLGDFTVIKTCKTTKARVSRFQLNNDTLELPIFMPVGTYGCMKGIETDDIEENMILSNTYHLRKLNKNVKDFMNYKHSMLTDSGGFQIGSLPNVEVVEEGVRFNNIMFTPENSMDIQETLGADIVMQLDEVVNPMEDLEKIRVATFRSVRWLDRCIKQLYYKNKLHKEKIIESKPDDLDQCNKRFKTSSNTENTQKTDETPNKNDTIDCNNSINEIFIDKTSKQILFSIVTGGLNEELRSISIKELLKRNPKGIAIGGLSGGEEKDKFADTVFFCTSQLPNTMPRYIMGVGYPEDIVICCALGTDMSDCVYPTRTARFGRVFTDDGDIYLTNKYKFDTSKICECDCFTCQNYNKSYLSLIRGTSNFCMLTTIHNMHYMRNLTKRIRESILEERFPDFIKKYIKRRFPIIPDWIKYALNKVNITFD